MPIETLVRHADFRVGTLGSLLVVCINSAKSLDETLAGIERTHAGLLQAKTPKVTTLTILVAKDALAPPPAAVRERAAAMARRNEHTARGSGTLVLMRGLGGVVARTFLSAFFMLNRAQVPQAVLGSYADAARWVQQLPGQEPALAARPDLAAALEAFVRDSASASAKHSAL
jgi:voltage-gated potassium channel Kch